jgi:hypothetical protein
MKVFEQIRGRERQKCLVMGVEEEARLNMLVTADIRPRPARHSRMSFVLNPLSFRFPMVGIKPAD